MLEKRGWVCRFGYNLGMHGVSQLGMETLAVNR